MQKVSVALLILAFSFSLYARGQGDSGSSASQAGGLSPYELHVVLPVSGTVQRDIAKIEARISAHVKEKINATVKITQISYSNWTQQTNLMLGAGEKIDLIWMSSNYGYNAMVSRGQARPLDDLLASQGQGIVNLLGDRYLDPCRVGGKIYGVPSTRDMAARYGAYLKRDLVEKYGIDTRAIVSPETLETVLKLIKEREPQVLPMAVTQNITMVENLYYPIFDQLSDKFGVLRLSDNNFKVINLYETPEYADFLRLVRRWYEAGYVSKDAATTQDAPRELFRADRAFSYLANYKPGQEGQEVRITGKDIVCVFFHPTMTTTAQITNMMAGIPITSGDPQRAMMLLNLWFTDPDLVNLYDNGIEGTHYVRQSEGTIWYPSGIDASKTGYSPTAYFIGNNYLSHIWKGDPLDLWKQMDEFNRSAIPSKAMGFSFNQDPVKTAVAAVQNVVSEYRRALENGAMDPVTALPAYQVKLKSAGIDSIIAEKQRQLDAWVAAQRK